VIVAATPATFVKLKVPMVALPVAAVTEYGPPATVLAVNKEGVATPLELVTAVVVFVPFPKVPLATPAPDGAVKVTVTPLKGFPPLSTTVACIWANAVLTVTLCVAPALAVTFAGGPGVFVRLKLTAVSVPATAPTL